MKKITNYMKKNNIDLIFLANFTNKDNNIRYLAGQNVDIGFILITKSKRTLFASILEKDALNESILKKNKLILKSLDKKLDAILGSELQTVLKNNKNKILNIGINASSLSANGKELLISCLKKVRSKLGIKTRIKFTDIGPFFCDLRTIKTEDEIKTIKKSCLIANKILEKALTVKNLKKLKTEKDLAKHLHIKTIENGCDLAFNTVVASRENSAVPHHTTSKTAIKKGFLLIDFGVKYNGYHSDMTRTVYIGKPSKSELENYNLVKSAQEKATDMIREKIKCEEPHNLVATEFGNKGKFFIHSLGHGIGLDIHELPRLAPKSSEIFQNGMTFTNEPGLYFPKKYGIRIEDSLVLQNSKAKVLTSMSKDLIKISI